MLGVKVNLGKNNRIINRISIELFQLLMVVVFEISASIINNDNLLVAWSFLDYI